MTRSPIVSTLIPLVPLAALGWPLASVLNQADFQAIKPEKIAHSTLVKADLFVQSAHPFSEISVTIDEATWTFAPDEDLKEVNFPQGSKADLTVSIAWPADTPETAALFTLRPEGKQDRTHTLWGLGEVTEEITFTWEDEE